MKESTDLMERTVSNRVATQQITNWNNVRQDELSVRTKFEESGNKFVLNLPDHMSGNLHIYIGNDGSGQINFFVISEEDDAAKKFNWITSSQLSANKTPLPQFQEVGDTGDSDAIAWQAAKNRIDWWISSSIRNGWIAQRFNDEVVSDAIYQVFVIKSEDFIAGMNHDCYLSLKLNDEKNHYTADLIVVNNDTNALLNVVKKEFRDVNSPVYLEDMARPVPPFGQDRRKFGVIIDLFGE